MQGSHCEVLDGLEGSLCEVLDGLEESLCEVLDGLEQAWRAVACTLSHPAASALPSAPPVTVVSKLKLPGRGLVQCWWVWAGRALDF